MSYVPHSAEDVRAMLEAVGVAGVEELYDDVPRELLLGRDLAIPPPLAELDVVRLLRSLAQRNEVLTCFAGGGIYDHYVPAAVDQILRRSEFYTAYTPYQPEVAQGSLQVIYEFQTAVCELSGMDVANASIYDGASACAEAVRMAVAVAKDRRHKVLVSATLHPHYCKVLDTYVAGLDLDIRTVPHVGGVTDLGALADSVDGSTAAVVLQNPNFFGALESWEDAAAIVHAHGALLVAVFDPVVSALLKSPGECGADIAVAEGQPLGNAMSFGGPGVGLFAARREYIRQMPGRIAGATVDEDGKRGFVLTLQTREQHIRRERATSNICTNQALNALAATVHVATLGLSGMRQAAELSLRKAHYAFERLIATDGFEPLFPGTPFFKEFAVRGPDPAGVLIAKARARGYLAGVDLGRFGDSALAVEDGLLIAVTEKRTREEIDGLVEALAS
ncbi:MAG: aminomethyl-transferring glycine dehydrogenase subunit GcvPA [Gemmatimonadetes bacterium]|nr:aminomethyl-transferring glycine dehydrogenase subunit GcvPA [Gemmatimonadota bacterium]